MPSSSAYSMAAGYPASAITLYAVLAGHGADGGLWGISGDVQCGLFTGAVRNGGRRGHYYKYHGWFCPDCAWPLSTGGAGKLTGCHHGMICKPCTGVFLRSGTFILSVREPPFLHRDMPAATAPLPADRPPGVPLCLLYSITADRCCRRDAPQNPHGRPDTLCRSALPPDQWQKCRLRADLLPGPAAVRRLLPHAVLPGGGPFLPAAEAVPRPGRRPSVPLPTACFPARRSNFWWKWSQS